MNLQPPPGVVSLSLDTATKMYMVAASIEDFGVTNSEDDLWFVGRDAAGQILEAITNQCGEAAAQRARDLHESLSS